MSGHALGRLVVLGFGFWVFGELVLRGLHLWQFGCGVNLRGITGERRYSSLVELKEGNVCKNRLGLAFNLGMVGDMSAI